MSVMARFKDSEWPDLPNEWQFAHVRVLMDIRDELKRLNNLLHCSNFTGIPHTLTKIRINTTKRKRKAKP